MPVIPDVSPLLKWYHRYGRDLPWRNSGNPYLIWVSEIILQQTRVIQGKPYYDQFILKFPDVFSLAEADPDTVMKHWEGLGYYARARNLHAAAKYIVQNYQGEFPQTIDELLTLKGIGPYTARAIASFAFGKKTAVLDGNVYRVLSRLFADPFCVDALNARNHFQPLADQLLGNADSAAFNQAMMDLGSMVCKPTNPDCENCPLQNACMAFIENTQSFYPVRKIKIKRPVREAKCFVVFNPKKEIWIRRRPDSGLWGGLYEMPWYYPEENIPAFLQKFQTEEIGSVHHIFTHFELKISIVTISVSNNKFSEPGEFLSLTKAQKLAFPKAMHKIFDLLRNK